MHRRSLAKNHFLQAYGSEKYGENSTSKILNKLKVYLMSRNAKKQVFAINMIQSQLKKKDSEVTADVLVQTDVPGLLCDVMNNHNPSLIGKVFSCLLDLSKNELFYKMKHTAIVIESTCRTIRILSQDTANLKIIFYGLKLLFHTLSRSDEGTKVNYGKILELTKELLFNSRFQQVHLSVISVLQSILKNEKFTHPELNAVIQKTLYILYSLNKNNKKRFVQHISLATDVIQLSLRKLFTRNDNFSHFNKSKEAVWKIILSTVVPFIQLEMEKKKCHAGKMRKLLTCLLAMFECLNFEKQCLLSFQLASKGFLTSLPSLRIQYKDESLDSSLVGLQCYILTTQANKHFGPQDGETCTDLIMRGLQCLPPDTSVWPKFLAYPQAHKVHYAVIVNLYFVLLCSKSFTEFPTHLPFLCRFLTSQKSFPRPDLLKAIWLVFAVLSLSQTEGDGGVEAKKLTLAGGRVLVGWLRSSLLTPIFTPHPALLLWTFSSHVSNKMLKINVMTLWLKEEGKPSMNEITNLVLRNREAAFCLVDVMTCCSVEIIPQTLSVLKTLLGRDKAQSSMDTSVRIWANLPQILSSFTSLHSEHRAMNAACLVFLACKVVPALLDSVLVLRISWQVLAALRHPFADPSIKEGLNSQLFKLAITLVIKMNQANDYRVLEMFLQDTVLLQALLSSFKSENKIFTVPALRLLSCLQHFQRFYSIKAKCAMYISGETLLLLMSNIKSRSDCMHLLSVMQAPCHLVQPFISLPPGTQNHIIRALYFEFQMITFTNNNSWRCQKLMLEYCKTYNSEMESHLLTQPWTYTVIKIALKRNGMNNKDELEWLGVWLAGLLKYKIFPFPYNPRALCQDSLSESITDIAKSLVKHNRPGCTFRNLLMNNISKVTSLGVYIPK